MNSGVEFKMTLSCSVSFSLFLSLSPVDVMFSRVIQPYWRTLLQFSEVSFRCFLLSSSFTSSSCTSFSSSLFVNDSRRVFFFYYFGSHIFVYLDCKTNCSYEWVIIRDWWSNRREWILGADEWFLRLQILRLRILRLQILRLRILRLRILRLRRGRGREWEWDWESPTASNTCLAFSKEMHLADWFQ